MQLLKPEQFSAEKTNNESKLRLLKYIIYLVFALHTAVTLNAGFEIGWLNWFILTPIFFEIVLLAMLLTKDLSGKYQPYSYILIGISLIIFLSYGSPAPRTENNYLIAPFIPLIALFLLGKKPAWVCFAIIAIFVSATTLWLKPDPTNNYVFQGLLLHKGQTLIILITLACLVTAQIHLNLNSELSAQLHKFATSDYLTGVLNRHGIDAALEKAKNRAIQNNEPLALIIADIDFFKDLNDEHGHLAGDWCLENIAASLQMETHRIDPEAQVGRYGGEEFIVIMPNCKTIEEAQETSEHLRKMAGFAGSENVLGQSVSLTMGLAYAPAGSSNETLESLLDKADIALYQGKDSGRDKLVTADS